MTELHAVVTGASSGIGAATVRRLVAEGWDVTAVARRTERLAELAKDVGCATFTADITSDEDVAALAAELTARGPVHALVNNAGGAIGMDTIAASELDTWTQQYATNVVGTVRVTQALLPALQDSGRGDVVIVTSTAGHEAYENGGGYVAAKTAEVAMARTLRLELTGTGVRVIEIAPGMVHTEEFSLNRFEGDQARADAVYQGIEPLIAADVADAIAWTLTRPHHVNIDQMVVRPREQGGANKLVRR
ncbi:SDR family oxidoreductase [Demequina oxidasica]|uniref:SDR family oxidoreductase n=1 Tax=Demequina oxidasica TaxID=676199 RepID=UPI000785C150|nr:SDR family oxidoreductase [Demequina oxidasica]